MSKALTYYPIAKLVEWKHNPRTIDEDDKERLKKQLLDLGQYKPIIIVEEDSYAIVLGGNMRLTALRELVDEGHDEFANVWVSIVEADTDERKLKYALSDNDRAGRYNEDQLATLVGDFGGTEMYEDYRVDTGYTATLDSIGERYDMSEEHKGEAAGKSKEKEVSFIATEKKCPKCGYEY